MKNNTKKIIFSFLCAVMLFTFFDASSQKKPSKKSIMASLRLANDYYMNKWPDPGQSIPYPARNREYEANLWTRAVYYEGLMYFYKHADKQQRYINYMEDWGNKFKWGLRGANGKPQVVRNADNQCAGQTYLELYLMDKKPEKINDIKASIDAMMATDKINDWTWIDAIQMSMPIFAQLGVITGDSKYFDRAFEMYNYTKTKMGDNGLYNPEDKLWWRDADFDPPYKEPNGEDCYWSRGNGWVVMAMARMLYFLPKDEKHRAEYSQMLKDMCEALAKVQREDGLWNVSLHDPNNYGGKEFSGTAMFTFGMAYGVNNGILDKKTYAPIIYKAWNGLVNDCLHPNGFLGYVQGSGKEPKEAQPVTYDKEPDFDDYSLGAFLMAGTEIYNMR